MEALSSDADLINKYSCLGQGDAHGMSGVPNLHVGTKKANKINHGSAKFKVKSDGPAQIFTAEGKTFRAKF